MSSTSALRELQRELETKANDLSKLQKGKTLIDYRFLPVVHSISTFYRNINISIQILRRLCYLDSILSIYFHKKPNMVMDLSDIAKNHQVRKKYTIQLGENELVLKVFSPLSLVSFTCLLVHGSVARRGSTIREFSDSFISVRAEVAKNRMNCVNIPLFGFNFVHSCVIMNYDM